KRALPFRYCIARIERHARHTDGGRPVMDRFFHAGGSTFSLANRRAAIFGAIGNNRPAIILSGFRDVYFIATARPMLIGPELSRLVLNLSCLLIAMAVRPDLCQRIFSTH